jgi:hypothetical protein
LLRPTSRREVSRFSPVTGDGLVLLSPADFFVPVLRAALPGA